MSTVNAINQWIGQALKNQEIRSNGISRFYCYGFFMLAFFLYAPHSSAATDLDINLLGNTNKLHTSGYIKNETAYRFREPRSYTKIRNILYLDSRYTFNNWSEVFIAGRAYHDLAYDLFEYDTISARTTRDVDQPLAFVEGLPQEKDSSVAEIRELYLELESSNADIRIGRQFIIWGVLTGVRVIDEINPMDFREFIIPSLMDYRIPLWSVKFNSYFDNNAFQAIFIPDIRFHKPAPKGSEWELFQEVDGTLYPTSFKPKNTEIGFRLSTVEEDTDLSFSYFYTWDDFPVLYRTALVEQEGAILNPEFFPRYKRMHIFGSTFEKPIMGQIFKMEFAYVIGKYFGLTAVDRDGDGFLDHQGVLKRDHFRFGAGLDFNILKTEFSPSVTQWVIVNYDSAILQDRFDTSINLFVRKQFPKRNTVFEMLAIYLVNFQELYLKPKISFLPTNKFQVTIGLDLFYGEKSRLGVIAREGRPTELMLVAQRAQFIGNFSNHDRAFVEFKYSF